MCVSVCVCAVCTLTSLTRRTLLHFLLLWCLFPGVLFQGEEGIGQTENVMIVCATLSLSLSLFWK